LDQTDQILHIHLTIAVDIGSRQSVPAERSLARQMLNQPDQILDVDHPVLIDIAATHGRHRESPMLRGDGHRGPFASDAEIPDRVNGLVAPPLAVPATWKVIWATAPLPALKVGIGDVIGGEMTTVICPAVAVLMLTEELLGTNDPSTTGLAAGESRVGLKLSVN
jgi:hypothetical protein